ncbi:unnamed protein product [Closterium sp. NIES-54]
MQTVGLHQQTPPQIVGLSNLLLQRSAPGAPLFLLLACLHSATALLLLLFPSFGALGLTLALAAWFMAKPGSRWVRPVAAAWPLLPPLLLLHLPLPLPVPSLCHSPTSLQPPETLPHPPPPLLLLPSNYSSSHPLPPRPRFPHPRVPPTYLVEHVSGCEQAVLRTLPLLLPPTLLSLLTHPSLLVIMSAGCPFVFT